MPEFHVARRMRGRDAASAPSWRHENNAAAAAAVLLNVALLALLANAMARKAPGSDDATGSIEVRWIERARTPAIKPAPATRVARPSDALQVRAIPRASPHAQAADNTIARPVARVADDHWPPTDNVSRQRSIDTMQLPHDPLRLQRRVILDVAEQPGRFAMQDRSLGARLAGLSRRASCGEVRMLANASPSLQLKHGVTQEAFGRFLQQECGKQDEAERQAMD